MYACPVTKINNHAVSSEIEFNRKLEKYSENPYSAPQ